MARLKLEIVDDEFNPILERYGHFYRDRNFIAPERIKFGNIILERVLFAFEDDHHVVSYQQLKGGVIGRSDALLKGVIGWTTMGGEKWSS